MRIVYITGSWCQPCKAMHPKVEALAAKKKILLVTLDMENPNDGKYITPYAPLQLPTVVLETEDGLEIARLTGQFDINELQKRIKEGETEGL